MTSSNILDLMDEGILDKEWLVESLLKWMGENQARNFFEYYQLNDLLYEENTVGV